MFEKLAEKLITTVISIGTLFFPVTTSTNAVFENSYLSVQNNNVYISTTLSNCFTEDLDKIIMSGQKIKINFEIELIRTSNNKNIHTKELSYSLKYSLIDEKFYISSSLWNEKLETESIEEAKKIFTVVDEFKVTGSESIKRDKDYFIQITADLEPIVFLGNKDELDLMVFWNKVKPVVQSKTFNSSIFIL